MKAKTHHRPASRHSKNGHGATFDTMLASAKQAGRDARDAAMGQIVDPAMQAARQAGHQIEQGFHDSMEFVDGQMKKLESQTTAHPIGALACAVGAGVMIGLWLGRK
jgi:ElaB/YqjD/DUF883 family membrane-anchored ribosome-binding protein